MDESVYKEVCSSESSPTATSSIELLPIETLVTENAEIDDQAVIQLERRNGFDDPVVMEFFKEDIQFVYDHTESYSILIDCYDADLNFDGYNDIIVLIQGTYFSGSAGNPIHVLLNNQDGTYTDISEIFTLLRIQAFWSDDEPIEEFFISDAKSDGYSNILIQSDTEIIAELHYSESVDRYRYPHGVYYIAKLNEDILGR
jgi:succinate dehydrogenase flavin-adding protein (antitoxin of CptAB toxin-antitoxin module)